MSIEKSFDSSKIAVINPNQAYEKSEILLKACIINFSCIIMDALKEQNLIEYTGISLKSVAIEYPVYRFIGTDIGIVQSTAGAPVASSHVEEVGHIFSCGKFVMFGSCGALDKNICENALIVPTHAYRDEGVSYHYAPPSDYIRIKNATVVGEILKNSDIDFVYGRTWTTDAFFRETKRNMQQRKKEGCIAVEMEVSACQAVCDFRGYEFYNFLYRADNLDCDKWDRGILGLISLDARLKNFSVALLIAKQII